MTDISRFNCQSVRTRPGAHLPSYSLSTRGSFPVGKAAGEWKLSYISI